MVLRQSRPPPAARRPPPATRRPLPAARSVNHIFRFLHICWQVTGKEWHRVRNADVSRWLTLGQHWCRWVLLSFHAFVRPSMGLGLCIAYKALGRNGLQFGMLMYPDGLHSAFMDAYGYCCWSVCPSICPFVAFSGGCAFADKSLGTNGIKFDMMM